MTTSTIQSPHLNQSLINCCLFNNSLENPFKKCVSRMFTRRGMCRSGVLNFRSFDNLIYLCMIKIRSPRCFHFYRLLQWFQKVTLLIFSLQISLVIESQRIKPSISCWCEASFMPHFLGLFLYYIIVLFLKSYQHFISCNRKENFVLK